MRGLVQSHEVAIGREMSAPLAEVLLHDSVDRNIMEHPRHASLVIEGGKEGTVRSAKQVDVLGCEPSSEVESTEREPLERRHPSLGSICRHEDIHRPSTEFTRTSVLRDDRSLEVSCRLDLSHEINCYGQRGGTGRDEDLASH